ncbi:MAG TPA: HNH endonuclease [Gaiellaceae bacterium]|nr:HNH endonuclease [Gaiellaceae bacterium]
MIAAQPYCSHCGATRGLTADHLIPLARGGNPLGPLRVLCRRCNSRRGAPPMGAA